MDFNKSLNYREDFQNRILKVHRWKSKWARKQHLDSYRLYDQDIPSFPLIIDRYGDFAVINSRYGSIADENEKASFEWAISGDLSHLLGLAPDKIIWKSRELMKGLNQYQKQNQTGKRISIREGKLKCLVNLSDYLDTGLFMDHRPMRHKLVTANVSDKTFLNLFCYTGVVSVAAAIGGYNCTSIDMSNSYLSWAQDNFKHNEINLSEHQFLRRDVLAWVKGLTENDKWDCIFLDPPTFSNSTGMTGCFDVVRHHGDLIHALMQHLNPGGNLIFSCNKRGFKLDQRVRDSFMVHEITSATIPRDFRNQKIHYCANISF